MSCYEKNGGIKPESLGKPLKEPQKGFYSSKDGFQYWAQRD